MRSHSAGLRNYASAKNSPPSGVPANTTLLPGIGAFAERKVKFACHYLLPPPFHLVRKGGRFEVLDRLSKVPRVLSLDDLRAHFSGLGRLVREDGHLHAARSRRELTALLQHDAVLQGAAPVGAATNDARIDR